MLFAYFLPHFPLQFIIVEWLVLHTIYLLNTEIYQLLDQKSAIYNWEWLKIKNGLKWAAHFMFSRKKRINKSPIFIFRSVQSVPMLAAAASAASIPPMSHTWDGEPCPVHHQHAVPLAALYGLGPQMMGGPASVPPSVISGATTVRRARSIGNKFIVIFW